MLRDPDTPWTETEKKVTDTKLEPKTVGMKMETDTHTGTGLLTPLPWVPSFSLVGLPLLPPPSHPLLSFLISSPTMKLISLIFFGWVELGESYTPLFSCFLIIPSSLFFFGLYEYIYMDRIKKNEIDFPFLSLPPSCLPKPQNLGLPPPLLPRTLVYCLFEVRAEVTDTVFNCT